MVVRQLRRKIVTTSRCLRVIRCRNCRTSVCEASSACFFGDEALLHGKGGSLCGGYRVFFRKMSIFCAFSIPQYSTPLQRQKTTWVYLVWNNPPKTPLAVRVFPLA